MARHHRTRHHGSFLTRRDLDHATSLAKRARDEREREHTKKEYMTGQIAQTIEVTAGAFAVGALGGRYGRMTLLGLDADLLAGLAVVGAGYFGMAGRYSDHLHNLGDGILAGYATKVGASFGNSMRVNAGLPALTAGEGPGTATAAIGAGGYGYGSDYITAEELARMSQPLRAYG